MAGRKGTSPSKGGLPQEHMHWTQSTYERLVGIDHRQRDDYQPRSSWQTTQSASDRMAEERQSHSPAYAGTASSSSSGPAPAPAPWVDMGKGSSGPPRPLATLAENAEFEDFMRIRRDLGMAPANYSPGKYTQIVEGRPVQAPRMLILEAACCCCWPLSTRLPGSGSFLQLCGCLLFAAACCCWAAYRSYTVACCGYAVRGARADARS